MCMSCPGSRRGSLRRSAGSSFSESPLSRAYGLTSLTYMLVLVASIYVLGEPVRRLHAVGTILIVIGIACLLSGD